MAPSKSSRGSTKSLVTESQFLAPSATLHCVPPHTKAGVVREGFTEEEKCDLGLEEWMRGGWASGQAS